MWLHKARLPNDSLKTQSACALLQEDKHGKVTQPGPQTEWHWRSGCDACRIIAESSECPFCKHKLKTIESIKRDLSDIETRQGESLDLDLCQVCGWWRAKRSLSVDMKKGWYGYLETGLAYAELARLDMADLSEPLQSCRDALCINPDSRITLHPQRLEEIVESVFADLGYDTVLTNYAKDGGIDVYVYSPTSGVCGVQVKRTSNTIGVDQIRSLVGALVLRGVPRGIFVTTSRFSDTSRSEAALAWHIGVPIELIDCEKLFELLKIAQIKQRSNWSAVDIGVDLASLATASIFKENWKG